MAAADDERIVLSAGEGVLPGLRARQRVSVYFDFRSQGMAFEAVVLKNAGGAIEVELPELMYRSLSRRWPRIPAPRGLAVEFLLPDAELKLDCPESEEWVEVELPELREGLDSSNLAALVESYKSKARQIASEGRVVMYKDHGPADFAEHIVSRLGRILFVPSTTSGLPISDPYPAGRIITKEMAEDFEGPSSLAGGSDLESYLAERAAAGLNSAVWCPVVYYRYTVGIVQLFNGPDRPWALDFEAVDLAWEFSRVLAYFLKRHGYFATKTAPSGRSGSIVDATPAGLLVELPPGGPRISPGSTIGLKLQVGETSFSCQARVARRYEHSGSRFYGIAFVGLPAGEIAALSRNLYGEAEAAVQGTAG
jgi:hypothetical protein